MTTPTTSRDQERLRCYLVRPDFVVDLLNANFPGSHVSTLLKERRMFTSSKFDFSRVLLPKVFPAEQTWTCMSSVAFYFKHKFNKRGGVSALQFSAPAALNYT